MDRHALLARIGRRGTVLLLFGVTDWFLAWGLWDPEQQPPRASAYRGALAVAPFRFWAVTWAAVGVVCAVYAFRRIDWPGFSAAVSIKLIWAGCFAWSYFHYAMPRAWVGAVQWGLVAGLVYVCSGWREAGRDG
jgi:hypothetical protein